MWGLKLGPEVRAKLIDVSAAASDRMLAPERGRLRVTGRPGTKPVGIDPVARVDGLAWST